MKYLGKNLTNNVKDLHIEFSKILLNKRRDSSWISKGPNIKMPILLKLMCSLAHLGNLDLIPGSGRSSGGGNDNPLQYSCLENSMDGGTW